MAKKTLQTHYAAHRHFVIAVGYTLFTCIVLGLVTGTVIPLARILVSPHVRVLNVSVFMVSLIISAVLPPLIAYLFGDAGTRSRSRQTHHYNGVMFSMLSYWLATTFSLLVGANIATVTYDKLPVPFGVAVGFLLPVIVVALVVGILAYYYHRKKKRQQVELLEYRPFQLTLITVLVAFFVGMPVQQLLMGQDDLGSLLTSTGIFVGAAVFSYALLMRGRGSALHKMMLAVVGVTLGQVTFYTASQFAPDIFSISGNVVQFMTILLASVMVWAVYLYVTRLSYHK